MYLCVCVGECVFRETEKEKQSIFIVCAARYKRSTGTCLSAVVTLKVLSESKKNWFSNTKAFRFILHLRDTNLQ